MIPLPLAQPQTRPAVSGSCEPCVFVGACGGYRDFGLFNCFQQFCCGGKAGCDEVCPNNPSFTERVGGVHGLRFDDLKPIHQRNLDLPIYVPHLNHRYGRNGPLEWPVVAVTTYELFRIRKGVYAAEAESPASLRAHFHLAPHTRVILRGTDTDKPLEKYWEHRVADRAPEQLARLGIDLVIGPNFSHFNDVPRTDNIYNRKRQLTCLEELQAAGINVAPHLNDVATGDWEFWRSYLSDNPSVTLVAKEFQTGNKPRDAALRALDEIDAIQQHVGRAIHPILIGGAQITEHAAARFETFTVLDSRPFMNAVKRHAFRSKGRRATWYSDPTLPGFGIGDILSDNLQRYSLWLSLRAKSKSNLRHLRHRQAG